MRLAVYTTIYSGVESYLPDWYDSLRAQTDRDFDLWIGLDELTRESVQRILGAEVKATWVAAHPGATPAEIRNHALTRIAATSSGVVLVDSDDQMHPTRVEAARAELESSDFSGCALCLIDEYGASLDRVFGLPAHVAPETILPRNNIFGFSNSAIRSDLLRHCLPIPREAVLADWALATRAWLFGAKFGFDPVPRMDYRQYSTNTARLRYPISANQVISDTALVRQHFRLLLDTLRSEFDRDRVAELRSAAAEVEMFRECVILDRVQLDSYVEALNAEPPATVWWSTVACQSIQEMWNRGAHLA